VTALRVATAPVSWGIWEQTIDRDDLVPPRSLLETVTAMGYRALETGPPGYIAADGAAAAELIAQFDVEFVATFLPLRLDDEDAFREDLRALDRTTAVLAATGGGIVLLADAERPERAAIAGRPGELARDGFSPQQLDRAAERLESAVALCAERGLRAALHPHAASYIETPSETDAILVRTSAQLGLCVDTGHTVVAGGNPIEQVRRHADRLAHVHLKDVDAGVLARLRQGEIDMDEAWVEGIFCPFGEGVVPLRQFLAEPAVRNLDGYAVLEQDRMAVRVADLPSVRAVEERNLERVREWLA
jgi:inosose dehydratase